MAGCSFGDIGCIAGDVANSAANSAFGKMVEDLYDGAVELAKFIGTWWMEAPPPNLDSAGLSLLQQDLSWFVWVFGVIGFFLGLIRLVLTEDVRSSAINLGKPIFNLILATGVYMAGVPILLTAGDETARWLLDRSTSGDSSMEMLIPSTAVLAGNHGIAFVLYLLMLLGAGVNFLFMIFRNIGVMVIMAFIAVLAAASGTEAGNQAWRKVNGFLVALLLFKPVAAGIYALGFRLMIDDTDLSQTSDLGAGMASALYGLLILVLAALALPSLIKLIAPAAAAGSSGFSGGAALAGAAGVAAGAAVLAGGMGAGAAAARGGAGAMATTGSGPGGQAATTAGGSGSSGGPGPSGDGPAGGAPSTTETASGAPSGGTGGEASGNPAAAAAGGTDGGTSADGSGGSTAAGSGSSGSTGSGPAEGSSSRAGAPTTASTGSTASTASGAPVGSPAGGTSAGSGTAAAGARAGASGRGRWAEAINRYNQGQQAGSQTAQGARLDRALDDERDQG